jgi:hypothetical protein
MCYTRHSTCFRLGRFVLLTRLIQNLFRIKKKNIKGVNILEGAPSSFPACKLNFENCRYVSFIHHSHSLIWDVWLNFALRVFQGASVSGSPMKKPLVLETLMC